MGSGGVILPPDGYWPEIQEVLARHDILLVADEIICGFGRTGEMFGSELFGLDPDLMTVAKQLSSGYAPISAVLLAGTVYNTVVKGCERVGAFAHGFTYSGHPVAASVALATLDRYKEIDVLGRVRALAPVLQAELVSLSKHPLVGDARSIGLLGAVELAARSSSAADSAENCLAKAVADEAQRQGVIFRALDAVIAICPPLIISEEELRHAMRVLAGSLDHVASSTP